MGALILKSKNALNSDVPTLELSEYRRRVYADGGVIINEQSVVDAMGFANTNDIAPFVNSATSANWGVKFSGSIPVKLYSLFGSAGDVEGNPDSYLKHVIEGSKAYLHFTQSSVSNYFQAKTPITDLKSVAMAVVARMGSGTEGSLQWGAALGSVQSLVPVSTAEDVISERVFFLIKDRNGENQDPINYITRPQTFTTSGFVTHSDTNYVNWDSNVYALDEFRLKRFINGAKDSQVSGVLGSTIPTSNPLYFTLGARRKQAAGAVTFDNFMWGQVAESWLLINSNESAMSALSLRLSELY